MNQKRSSLVDLDMRVPLFLGGWLGMTRRHGAQGSERAAVTAGGAFGSGGGARRHAGAAVKGAGSAAQPSFGGLASTVGHIRGRTLSARPRRRLAVPVRHADGCR